jgi:Raf kinase inhibitor-like YbhB/YbcL family protein
LKSSIFISKMKRKFAAIAVAIALLSSVVGSPGCATHLHYAFPSFVIEAEASMSLTISSPSFTNGGNIARKFTCDGEDVSPQLSWSEPPSGTKTLALLVDDPDAPVGNWNHWTMWNVPAATRGVAEGVGKDAELSDGSRQGHNDFRKIGYNGPCPPPGKPHRYYFKLYALDTKLDLKSGATKKELEAAMKGHILAQSEWMGRYGR